MHGKQASTIAKQIAVPTTKIANITFFICCCSIGPIFLRNKASWMELTSHEKDKLLLDDVRVSCPLGFSRDSLRKRHENVTIILIFHSFIILGNPGQKNFLSLLYICTPVRNMIIIAALLIFWQNTMHGCLSLFVMYIILHSI